MKTVTIHAFISSQWNSILITYKIFEIYYIGIGITILLIITFRNCRLTCNKFGFNIAIHFHFNNVIYVIIYKYLAMA